MVYRSSSSSFLRYSIQSIGLKYLPGDPARVKLLAELLSEKIEPLDFNREYCSYLAEVPYEKNVDEKKKSEKVLIISTGMGSPSVAIGLEELAMLGIKKFMVEFFFLGIVFFIFFSFDCYEKN